MAWGSRGSTSALERTFCGETRTLRGREGELLPWFPGCWCRGVPGPRLWVARRPLPVLRRPHFLRHGPLRRYLTGTRVPCLSCQWPWVVLCLRLSRPVATEGEGGGPDPSASSLRAGAGLPPWSVVTRRKKVSGMLEEEARELLSHFSHRNVDALLRATRNALEATRRRIHASCTMIMQGEGRRGEGHRGEGHLG